MKNEIIHNQLTIISTTHSLPATCDPPTDHIYIDTKVNDVR
jgi:hypothetical protein